MHRLQRIALIMMKSRTTWNMMAKVAEYHTTQNKQSIITVE